MTTHAALKDYICAAYRLLLAKCETRDACMDLSVDIRSTINALERIGEEDCYDRAREVER